jgi:hypothetical protein
MCRRHVGNSAQFDPSPMTPIRVIFKFSKNQLVGLYKSPETQEIAQSIAEFVPCMLVLHGFRCPLCPIFPSDALFMFFELVLIIGRPFTDQFGVFCALTHDPSGNPVTGFFL